MIPDLVRKGYRRHRDRGDLYDTIRSNVLQSIRKEGLYKPLHNTEDRRADEEDGDNEGSEDGSISNGRRHERSIYRDSSGSTDGAAPAEKHLAIIPTAKLSFAFCMLWFAANYFAMSCLQYTTVASVTILTSTSSFWTLLVGALTRTEKFTWRKLLGVAMSFAGIILISKVDLSARTDAETPGATRATLERREDSFPSKTAGELALGDALALLSAILYGVYTVTLKGATLKALPQSINMPLFFGFVGMFNFIFLAPLFPILHYSGLETFAFPPTRRIWTILIVNSLSSFGSDICWAYAMVLTSPLLVTVGLSLTIPLSLVGEMLLQGHYEGWVYWVGAAIVLGSFVFIDQEEKKEEELAAPSWRDSAADFDRTHADYDEEHDGEGAVPQTSMGERAGWDEHVS
jgi:solute carrier family 35, member F5